MSEKQETPRPRPIGTHVRHRGTKRWGVIKESLPQRDKTFEYRISRDLPLLTYERPETWWASYHIDRSEQLESAITKAEKE